MSTALHVATVSLAVAALLWACRFVHRRSPLAGLMFTTGILIRAIGAASFVTISYFGLPFMTQQQLGDGFWALAPDAEEYYRLSSLVAERWQDTITPGYVGPLALWMRAAGVNPASPLLFALLAHTLAVVTLVALLGQSRTRAAQQALLVCVAGLSFSPMLVFSGVFGLKDVFVATLIVILAVACLTLIGAAWTRTALRTNLLAAAGTVIIVWLIASIRAYLAIILWAALALTYAGCLIAGFTSRRRAVVQAAVALPALAMVIGLADQGGYPRWVRNLMASLPEAVVEHRAPETNGALGELDRRREAIDSYGGNSVLRRRSRATGSARSGTKTAETAEPGEKPQGTETAETAMAVDTTVSGRLEGLAIGIGAVFVPISILEWLADVDVNIGLSARLIADADTVALDLMTAAILWLVIVNRRQIAPAPLLFGLVLALLVALPLGYVMTNYGTLIRLRLMVAAPIWLLTLALAPRFAGPGSASPADPADSSIVPAPT
jgi:hypothetical protein